jgi:hypothetical protein
MVASLPLLVNQARPWPTVFFLPLRLGRECLPWPIEVVFGGPGSCCRLRAALPPFVLTAMAKNTLQTHYKGFSLMRTANQDFLA